MVVLLVFSYLMKIDGKTINTGLDSLTSSEDDAKEHFIKFLNEKYNIEYDKEDIEFQWGGCL